MTRISLCRRAFLAAAVAAALAGCKKPLPSSNQSGPASPSGKGSGPAPTSPSKQETGPAAGPAASVAVSRDGKVLAVADKEKRLHFWSLPDGKPLGSLAEPTDAPVYALVLTPDGKAVAYTAGKTVLLRSLPDGKLLHTFEGHDKEVRCLALSPDGNLLASGSADFFIRLWSLPEGKKLKTLPNQYFAINALAITPDSKMLVSGSGFLKGDVVLWDLPGGAQVKALPKLERNVTTLAIAADGTLLATGAAEKIRLWSLPDGTDLGKPIDTGTGLLALAISPDGKTLAGAGENGKLLLWSLPDGKPRTSAGDLPKDLAAVAFLPGEGQQLVAAGADGIVLLDLASGKKQVLALPSKEGSR